MAEALILEFDGVGREQYDAVNKRLGIDMASGEGDWPEGMLSHTAGAKAGGWVVFEVWESRGAQGQFMNCLLYTSPSPRDRTRSRMPSSA